jgi:hypothetical protein
VAESANLRPLHQLSSSFASIIFVRRPAASHATSYIASAVLRQPAQWRAGQYVEQCFRNAEAPDGFKSCLQFLFTPS